MSDPDVIAELAALPEPDTSRKPRVPMEGFGPLESRLANLEDRLVQLVALTARTGIGVTELAARPEYPHLAERERRWLAKQEDMNFQLTGGE